MSSSKLLLSGYKVAILMSAIGTLLAQQPAPQRGARGGGAPAHRERAVELPAAFRCSSARNGPIPTVKSMRLVRMVLRTPTSS